MANNNQNNQKPQAPQGVKPAETKVEVVVTPPGAASAAASGAKVEEAPILVGTASGATVEVQPVTVSIPASAEEKLVTVLPRETIPTTRIGANYYSFRKGVTVKVPASVRDHLAEKGIV